MTNVTRTPPLNTAVISTYKNASASGATELVAATTGKRIRVLAAVIVSTASNSVKLQSASTDISATFPLGANGGFSLAFNEHGWCQTAVGEALNLNMSVATATGIQLQYIVL